MGIRGRSLLSALVLSIVFLAPRAHAMPITSAASANELTFWAEYQCCEATATYTAATQTFSLNTVFGPGAFISTPSFFTRDLIGDYEVLAQVDHSGNVLGGTYSLFGQSADLGIGSRQALISGTITGSRIGGDASTNALVGSVDFFNPLLEVFAAAPSIAILSAPNMPCFCLVGTEFNRWEHDFSASLIQPDVFGYTAVPEPAAWLLLGIGVLGVGVFVTRRRNGLTMSAAQSL
jgi:hypothetical protein